VYVLFLHLVIRDDIFINRNRWWTLKPQWLYTADIKTIGREQVGRSRRYEDLSANLMTQIPETNDFLKSNEERKLQDSDLRRILEALD
jgi:hypothetical protein